MGGHALAALWLAKSTVTLQPSLGKGSEEETPALKQYYKQIWNLFYFEYLLYPFI